MMAEGDHLTDSERAVRFEEEVVSRLRAQDLPDTPLNRGAAAQHIASVRGDLCPTYDLVRERR